MHRTLIALLVTGALAAPASSDGLDKSRVPAGARAVVHVDVEALLASRLARQLEQLDPDFDLDFDLGEHEPMLEGVRPLQDVRSVTIFTVDAKSERFGAVVRTSDKADSLLQVAIAAEQYELVPLGGWQVHSWREGSQRIYGAVVPLEQGSDRLVLLANDAQLMSEGIAVLEGSGASLARGAKGQLAAAPRPGALLFVASNQPISELGDIDPSSSMARLVQGLVLQMGEAQGIVFANLSLVTSQPEDALRLQQILQGFTALTGLISDDVEEGAVLQRLASALSFQTLGSQLVVEFSYDLESLIRDLGGLHGGG